MTLNRLFSTLLVLLLCASAYAAAPNEVIPDFEEDSIPVLNDVLRGMQEDIEDSIDTDTVSSFYIGTLTRGLNAATGSVSYTGVGFQPTHVVFFTDGGNFNLSVGMSDATTSQCVLISTGFTVATNSATYSIYAEEAVGKTQTGSVSSMDSDGFTISWVRTGATSAANVTAKYIAFKP